MCLMLYIAADHPLPLIPWHQEKPDFHVAALSETDKIVRHHFSKPHVRYAGTEEGCGCPFNYGREYPENETEEADLAIARRSRERFVNYLRLNRVQEIYSCWAGEEAEKPEARRELSPEMILNDDFIFQNRTLCLVKLERLSNE